MNSKEQIEKDLQFERERYEILKGSFDEALKIYKEKSSSLDPLVRSSKCGMDKFGLHLLFCLSIGVYMFFINNLS